MCSVRSKKRTRGAMLLLTALMILVLIGVAALAVDLGQLHIAKRRAQTVCDACARAGAWYLEPGNQLLQTAKVTSAAGDCADANNQSGNRNVLRSGSSTPGVSISFPSTKSIEVDGDIRVNFGFARLLGFNTSTVAAQSVAELAESPGFAHRFPTLAVKRDIVEWGFDSAGAAVATTLQTDRLDLRPGHNQWIPYNGTLYPVSLPGVGSLTGYGNQLEGLDQGSTSAMVLALKKGDTLARWPATASDPTVTAVTSSKLNARIDRGGNTPYSSWIADCSQTSQIIVMPVVTSASDMRIIGFAGFFVERCTVRVPTAAEIQKGDNWEQVQVTGYFVPGIAGTKSMRWLLPFEQEQPNLIYRIRLTE